MLRALTLCLCTLFATTLAAQERPRAILVMDGSGSMWGQIDGKAKITIAQEVVGTVLGGLPDEQELGLTIYGHRRKGDCADIETVVAPGAGSKAAIQSAVDGISPKGKTPMTEAVRQAAEALKYTEEKATVILVSDGIETCDPDPCAAARALEQAGVDFTAHVVGFDVSEEEALRQMQCIADETGGTFNTASNADELAVAMVAVVDVEEVEPEPAMFEIAFAATEGDGGAPVTETLRWELFAQDSPEPVTTLAPGFSAELEPGDYRVTALRPSDNAIANREFTVTDAAAQVTLVLPPAEVEVTFSATDGRHGARVRNDLVWELFRGDERIEGPTTAPGLSAQLPAGEYRVSVIRPIDEAFAEEVFGVGRVNKQVVLELPEYLPAATLEAEGSAIAGSTLPVRWTGPDARNDYISVARTDQDGARYVNYNYTRDGSPLNLLMPPEPGSYEIRYVLNEGDKVLATLPVEVTPVEATVTPPEALPAGGSAQVRWTGPDYRNDYIAIFPEGADRYAGYSYTREGSPLDLRLPAEPGRYTLAYVMDQDDTVLASAEVEVTAVTATVTPPAELPAGGTVAVGWTGPDDRSDYIAIFAEGADRYSAYSYTREGNPVQLTLPSEPGRYRIAYVQDVGDTEIASAEVEVTAVTASVTPPAELPAGGTVPVQWTGPDDRGDYIAIFAEGADRYSAYSYTREGNPVQLTLPSEPGRYRIAYVQDVGDTEIASAEVEVTAVTASVTPPAELPAGGTVPVQWTGPDDRGDYIAIFAEGADRYSHYAYTRDGNPVNLPLPAAPGRYRIAYVQDVGDTEIASAQVEVSETTASVSPPASAEQGATIPVSWDGPDFRGDYIAVFPVGADRYTGYAYTRDGNPARVRMPAEPGEYEVAYVMDRGDTPIARVPITVTAASASVSAQGTATAGGTLTVDWEGPDNRGDYIAIFPEGADRYASYAYTRNGAPASLDLPDTPGNYTVKYILATGDTPIAEAPVTVQ